MDCIREHLVQYTTTSHQVFQNFQKRISLHIIIHHRNLQTLAYEIFKVKKNMTPEILQKYFPRRKAITVLEIAQRCREEVLKLSYMAQKLQFRIQFGTKNMGHFTDGVIKICVSYTSQKKKKFVNGPQRIVHVVNVKHTYKTLDFCKLPVRTYIVL